MKQKLSNAPVYYVLAQAQFNPIAAMVDYINQIQDKLRQAGYTLFELQKITQLRFETTASSPAKAEMIDLPVWCIKKPDQTAGFTLGQSSITYQTTHYQTHEQLFAELLFGLKIVHSIIQLEHLSRLGLRYLNAVLPLKGETIHQYLVDGLRGVSLGVKPRYILNESVFDTNELSPHKGTLVNRIHTRTALLGHPPDIMPIGLSLKSQFINDKAISHAVIDLDHFIDGQMPLDFEIIETQLVGLHKYIKEAFQATITNHAKKIWD